MLIKLLLFFSFIFSNTNVDGVLAVVEGEVILQSDALQQSYLMASQSGIDPFTEKDKFDILFKQVSDQLVDNLVLYDMAVKDTNIFVLDADVEENLNFELKRRTELAGSVYELERVLGEPLNLIRSKLRLEIRKSMLIEKYTSSIIQTISPSISDVKNFYISYKDSLPFLEERLDFSLLEWPVHINTEKELNTKLFLSSLKDSVLKDYSSFSFYAKKYSDDPGSAPNGGSLGFTVRGTLVPEYELVAFNLSPGEISEPFLSPFGCHLVLLEDRVGEKIKTSHILKRVEFDNKDFKVAADSLLFFLEKLNVNSNVNKFDSLCSHYNIKNKVFQGVYKDFPISSLPDFLAFMPSEKKGYIGPFVNDKSVFYAYLSEYKPEQKQTLENSYNNIFNLTRSMLIEDKILQLINRHSSNIYIHKNY